jgi:hypothetical protein
LWARSYERDFRDVLALQDEVARDIAEEIRVSISKRVGLRIGSTFGRCGFKARRA